MLSQRLTPSTRTQLVRLLRPPRKSHRPSPRLFTQNSQLLLVGQRALRPQLPYLARPSSQHPSPSQLSRLLTTESRQFIRDTAILSTRAAVLATFLAVCAVLITWGIRIETDERRNPTPSEWPFMTRQYLREARRVRDAGDNGQKIINWPQVGSKAWGCLQRLAKEANEGQGEGTRSGGDDSEQAHSGAKAMVRDISEKSYEWRAGFFEACMLCATAAEHMQGSVLDVTRKLVFPKEVMIGPSNPDPRPTPPYMATAPLEENCRPPFPSPMLFYRILANTEGLTTKQSMDMLSAAASFCEHEPPPEKGAQMAFSVGDHAQPNMEASFENAESLYLSAFQVAASALREPSQNIIDYRTLTLKERAEGLASTNLLHAMANLGAFYARNGAPSFALPIFLSVLRARRSARVSPEPLSHEVSNGRSGRIGDNVAGLIKGLFTAPSPPPRPPSGNDPFMRSSETPSCDDAALMLYVGEILFATGRRDGEGLAWTRQAVAIAESNVHQPQRPASAEEGGALALLAASIAAEDYTRKDQNQERCKDCLFAGVQNWETMLQRVSNESSPSGRQDVSSGGWKGWFGKGSNLAALGFANHAALDEELRYVEKLKATIIQEGIAMEMFKVKGQTGGTWIG